MQRHTDTLVQACQDASSVYVLLVDMVLAVLYNSHIHSNVLNSCRKDINPSILLGFHRKTYGVRSSNGEFADIRV